MYAKGMRTVKLPINNLAMPPQQLGHKSKFIKSFSVSMFIHNKVTKQSTVHRLCTFSNICHTHCMTLPVILLSLNYKYQSCIITTGTDTARGIQKMGGE